MNSSYFEILNQVVRQPRHPVTGEQRLKVALNRTQLAELPSAAPEVVDFSRGGCKLRWQQPLAAHEPVVIRLRDQASGLSLDLPAVVRWCKLMENDFVSGCQFVAPLDYEQLGELFLAGFLSTEAVAS